MTDIQRQTMYELICSQLAAHIPYEQADGIAQLKVLGHQKTLEAAIQGLTDADKVRSILQRIDEVTHG